MLAEPITVPGRGGGPPPQAVIPEGQGSGRGGGEVQQAVKEPTAADLMEMVAHVENNLKKINNTELQFSVHQGSGEVMVTVKEESTGKVIREIPPREVLNLAARVEEMVGLLFDKIG